MQAVTVLEAWQSTCEGDYKQVKAMLSDGKNLLVVEDSKWDTRIKHYAIIQGSYYELRLVDENELSRKPFTKEVLDNLTKLF